MTHHCERCDELEETVRQLRELITGTDDELHSAMDEFGLTRQEARVFVAFKQRENKWIDQERLLLPLAITSPRMLDDPVALLKVIICRIRRKLVGKYVIISEHRKAYKLERVNHDTPSISDAAVQAPAVNA